MDITGSYTFNAPPDRVWTLLMDPAVIASCIPGCEKLEPTGEDRYRASLTIALAAITGSYEGTVQISEKELQSARARFEAAIVEHRRLTSATETTSLIAETESRAARSNFEALIAELHANRQQLNSLRQRQAILQREYDGMIITAPRSGVILGEDLRKQLGSHYNLGQEICRIGELENFLLKIDVSEREIARSHDCRDAQPGCQQVTRGMRCDRHAVGEGMQQFVTAETRSRARGEQDADEVALGIAHACLRL